MVAQPLQIFQCPSAAEPDRYDYVHGQFAAYGGKGACGDYAPTWGVDAPLVNSGLYGLRGGRGFR